MADRSFAIAPERDLGVSDVRRRLAHEAGRLLSDPSGGDGASARIARVEIEIDHVDPFRWLEAQPFATKVFWSGRDSSITYAAAGVADVVRSGEGHLPHAVETIVDRLAGAGEGIRYFGGARFDSRAPQTDDWVPFGAYEFVLPRFVLTVAEDRTTLTCNLIWPQDGDRLSHILGEIRSLQVPVETVKGSLPLPISRVDRPDAAGWTRNIESALAAFEEGTLGKVVLARNVAFGFAEPVSPQHLLQQLKSATPACHHFCFQLGDAAFVGASPERLYTRRGRDIQTEAVAGTRPRGTSAHDDERLRDELMHSEKDQREHGFVQQSIHQILSDLCTEVRTDAHTSEMTLALGRHLYSGFAGTLRPGVTDADILRAMHPTPAVGGYPREEAMEVIRALEPFDRGWYAGPVGWIGTGEAEFAVAIRCGLVRDRQLLLFSGAGIVPGSDPQSEHAEVEQKISDFVRVLGLDNGRS